MKKRATPMLSARTRAIGGPRTLFGCSLRTTGLPLSCSCFHVGTQQQARRSRLSSLPSPFSLPPPFDRNSRFFSEASLSESERQNLIKEASRYMKEGAKQRAKENLDASLKAFYHALNAIERALEGGGTSPPSLEDQLEHMDILQQIAEVQYEMENFVDAEPNFRLLLAKAKQLLPRKKKKEGEEELHPEVVTAMINLASCLSAKVVHKESLAEAERQKILAKGFLARPSPQKEGDDNKEETTSEEEEVRPDENMLADLREAKGLVAEALHFREKIYQSRRHPEVLECIRMMGELSQDVGNHKAAIPYLEEYLAWVDSVGDAQHSHNDTDRFMLLQALHRSYLKSGANNERAAVIKGQLNSIMSELQEEEKRASEKKDQGENVTIIDLTDPKEMQSILSLAFGSVKKQHAALPEAAKKRLLPASEKQQKQKSTDTNRMKLSKKKETK